MEDKEQREVESTSVDVEAAPPEEQKNAKERLYDKVPLTVKHLNIIIAILVIALVTILVIGTLLGNGIIGNT